MDIETALRRYPRVTLTRAPTPLDHLPILSADLGIDLYLKRDDLTDLALGGDKPRKLEFEIGHALAQGADHLVTCGSAQSNHARLTAAAARRLGLGCTVVLSDDEYRAVQGNLLAVMLMGVYIRVVEVADHWDLEAISHQVCDELTAQGAKPYFIPVSGTTPRSCLGYVSGGLELIGQLREGGIDPEVVYTPFGTGGVFTATMTAFRAEKMACRFYGVSINRDEQTCAEYIDTWWEALGELLELDGDRPRGTHHVTADYLGSGYGDPTEATLDAIVLVAETEGILLDPVYTGKTMSGLLDHVTNGTIAQGETVVMVHTGGVPALFAYHEAIEIHLKRRGRIKDDAES